jgi:hypothetical protein
MVYFLLNLLNSMNTMTDYYECYNNITTRTSGTRFRVWRSRRIAVKSVPSVLSRVK